MEKAFSRSFEMGEDVAPPKKIKKLTSIVIREIQIKRKVIYCFIRVRMTIIKKDS